MRRAETLSQIQDAFNPTPLSTKEQIEDFYYETSLARTGDSYSDFVKMLSMQLEDSQDTNIHKIFIGHSGSGKTTELFRLKNNLEALQFVTGFGRCDVELDGGDVEYTDVLFLMLDILLKMCQANEIELKQYEIERIYQYWQTEEEITDNTLDAEERSLEGKVSSGISLANVLKVMVDIKGIIKSSTESRRVLRRKIEPRSSELIAQIKDVIYHIQAQLEGKGKRKMPVILLDGLDKIPFEQAKRIFTENGSRFADLPIHLIVTFPISLTYTSEYQLIQSWFPGPEKLPMIKVRKWNGEKYEDGYEEGMNTLIAMVEKRAELSLFGVDVLEKMILETGGYIRDLFGCIIKATARARVRGSARIEMQDARFALDSLESDMNGRYSEKHIPLIKRIYYGEKYLSLSDEITELLQTGVVLEYNGERWCDLHPLVEKWMLDHKKLERRE